MVLAPTPRTEEVPPGPGSQILPTPGHSPLVATLDVSARLADIAAPEGADESATYVPASMAAAMAKCRAVLCSTTSSLRNTVDASNAAVALCVISRLPSTLGWISRAIPRPDRRSTSASVAPRTGSLVRTAWTNARQPSRRRAGSFPAGAGDHLG